jgi:hypothetical protein
VLTVSGLQAGDRSDLANNGHVCIETIMDPKERERTVRPGQSVCDGLVWIRTAS